MERVLIDGNGRRICFDWMLEFRGPFDSPTNRASGWAGAMTLPRILSLADDGSLRIEPAPELDVLRMNPRRLHDLSLAADSQFAINNVRGDCLELSVEIRPEDAREFGVKVRFSPDGAEQTVVLYDAQSRKLKVDVSRSSLDSDVRYEYYRTPKALERLPEEARTVQAQEAPFELAPGEGLSLRLFLDRSVLEVFANSRQCITQRIYPTRPDSLGVLLFSRGGSVSVKSLQAWDMAPAHD